MKQIQLSNGTTALVDDEDYDRVIEAGPWHLSSWRTKEYARKNVSYGVQLGMHNFILDAYYVDHIDGCGLNNQKSNLRPTTHKQNLQNQKVQARSKSGYRGVSLFIGDGNRKRQWRARIKIDGTDITIGYFLTKEDAARAWNAHALEVWGEFAFQNIITEDRR